MAMNHTESPIRIRDAPAKLKSHVWQYFGFQIIEIENNVQKTMKDKTICKICNMLISYRGGSTTNMSTHLSRIHGINIKSSITFPNRSANSFSSSLDALDTEVPTEECSTSSIDQVCLNQALTSVAPSHSERTSSVTRAIGLFIATDMCEYSIVENPGFQNMINVLDPGYNIPSQTHFKDEVVKSLYDETKEKVVEDLRFAQFISLTTDSWKSFVTFTIHFINDEWKFVSYVLQTKRFVKSPTGDNLAYLIKQTIDEWDLKRHGYNPVVTTDIAPNMVIACQDLDIDTHVGCFAHTLNTAAQRGLNVSELGRLCSNVRNVVSLFHSSLTASDILKQKQTLLELPQHHLIMDVPTCWNSTYDMLSRYVEQQPAIFATVLSKDVKKIANNIDTLSDDDISYISAVLETLRPIKTITRLLCDEKNPTISMIHPLKKLILKNMQPKNEDSSLILAVKQAISDYLRPRYNSRAMYLLQSCALDPRFKGHLDLLSEQESQRVFDSLLEDAVAFEPLQPPLKTDPELLDVPELPELPALPESKASVIIIKPDPDEYNPPRKIGRATSSGCDESLPGQSPHSAVQELFDDVYNTKPKPSNEQSTLDMAKDELSAYRKEPKMPLDSNPLEWWKTHQQTYPLLSHLAKKYLGSPATSIAAERVFSPTGDTIVTQRAALSPDHVDQLIFMKENFKF